MNIYFSSTPSSSTSSTMKTMSSAMVTSTSVANTSLKSNSGSHTSVNGSENVKKESAVAKEPAVSSPTTSNRMDITIRIKSEPLSPSPEKPQSDRKSNGASPKPNTSKSRSTTGLYHIFCVRNPRNYMNYDSTEFILLTF